MPTEYNFYTIEQYLAGKVRNISVTDDAIKSILAENEIYPNTEYCLLTQKQRDLCLAGLYTWIALSPTTSEKVSDSDGDWSHSDGGEQMSAEVLKRFLTLANEIYEKYGLETVGSNKWGFSGRGFHNIHNFGNGRH